MLSQFLKFSYTDDDIPNSGVFVMPYRQMPIINVPNFQINLSLYIYNFCIIFE